MRRPIAFLATFLLSTPWTGSLPQAVSTPEDVIRRIVDQGFFDGHDNKLIGGPGDAAAVILTKILRGRVVAPDQIDRILVVPIWRSEAKLVALMQSQRLRCLFSENWSFQRATRNSEAGLGRPGSTSKKNFPNRTTPASRHG